MANEKIEVFYEYIRTELGVDIYHETLVYTNTNGEQFLATAFTTLNPADTGALDVSQAAIDAATGTPSVWGTLDTKTGSINSFDPRWVDDLLGPPSNPNPSVIVAAGDDLSSQWNTIVRAEQNIAAMNLCYSPATQNSNSVVSSALTAAGITPPTDNGLFSSHYAIAVNNILGTALVTYNPANGSTSTAYADGSIVTTGIHFADGSIGNSYSFPGYATGRDQHYTDGSSYSYATASGSTTEAYFMPDGSSTVNTYDATTDTRSTTTSDGAGSWQTTTTFTNGTTAESGNIVNPSNGSSTYYNFATDAYTQTVDTKINGNAVNVTYTYDPSTEQWVAHVNTINGKPPRDQVAADEAFNEVNPGQLADGDAGVAGTDVGAAVVANDTTHPNGLQTLNNGLPRVIDVLSFINAVMNGDPIPTFSSGLNMLSGFDPKNTNLQGAAGVVNGLLSLERLDQALKTGDTSTAILSAAQATTYISGAIYAFTGNTTAKAVSGFMGDALPYLNLIYNLDKGNKDAAAIALVDIIGTTYLGWSVPYVGWAVAIVTLVDAITTEAPPEIWGSAHPEWSGNDTIAVGVGVSTLYPPEPTVEIVTNSDGTVTEIVHPPLPVPDPGLDIAVQTYNGMLSSLGAIIDRLELQNPDFPLGVVANRMPSLTYRAYSGFQLTDIDPLTGVQVHPEIYYDMSLQLGNGAQFGEAANDAVFEGRSVA